MQILKPKFFFEKIYDIKKDFLKENNIKALILDVDNTLTLHDSPDLNPKISQWIEKMKEENIPLVILSNNSPQRVKPLAKALGLDFFTGTKPNKKDYEKVLNFLNLPKENVAGVGDQIFTDVWGANRVGIISILTRPFSKDEPPHVKFKRLLEKPIWKGIDK